jgi:hypothetical protein
MKPLVLLLTAALLCSEMFGADNTVISRRPANPYPPGPDSQPQADAPKGERIKGTFDQSKVFPGTTRSYTIYIPHQLDRQKPAPFMVLQDGGGYRADVVFDNLIHKKEIPALVGIFVMHGRVVAADTNTALDRFNRSYATTRVSSSTSCFRSSNKNMASGCPRMRMTAQLAARPAARSVHGPRRGNGPTGFAASSAASAPTLDCGAAMTTRRSSARWSRSPSEFSCRMAKMI